MRYTRYDINKKGKENLFLWIILILLLATLIGVGIYNIFIEHNGKEKIKDDLQISSEEDCELYIIQCGVYQNKDNAETLVTNLENDFTPFIIEENNMFKVMAGIYDKDNLNENEQALKSKGINNFTIKCKISAISSDEKIKRDLVSGYIQIRNKLIQDKNVKAIDTDKYKEWANGILNDYNGNNNDIDNLKKMINSMPKEYTKDNIPSDGLIIYNVIINSREN